MHYMIIFFHQLGDESSFLGRFGTVGCAGHQEPALAKGVMIIEAVIGAVLRQ
jgi:hypothetical protein